MELVNLRESFALGNQLSLRLAHFARGYFPCLDENFYSTYTVNRLFCILKNPNKSANFMGDRNARHEFIPGVVYLAPAFHPVVFRLDEQVRFISVHFNLELLYGVDLFSSTKEIYSEPMPDLIARLDACYEANDRMLAALEAKRSVYEAAERFLRKYGTGGVDLSARFAPFAAALECVSSHCLASTKVSRLAKAMGMSREAFSRSFAAKTGISPKKFFDRQLAHRAAELLRRPSATAREVSDELKFSSEFAFSRFFKKLMGVSPRAFQRQRASMDALGR